MSLAKSAMSMMIRTPDPAKLKRFYVEVLGLREVEGKPDMPVIQSANGVPITFYQGPPTKAEHNLCTFDVPNLEQEIKALEAKGVPFADFDRPDLKTVNHIATENGMKAAWFKDPDGNWICLNQTVR